MLTVDFLSLAGNVDVLWPRVPPCFLILPVEAKSLAPTLSSSIDPWMPYAGEAKEEEESEAELRRRKMILTQFVMRDSSSNQFNG